MNDTELGPAARLVPIRGKRTVELGPGLHAAYVEIEADDRCPHGVFGSSAAVDITARAALRRARFEAIERYSLAAIDWHTDRMRPLSRISERHLIELDFAMAEPFGRPVSDGMALPARRMDSAAAEPFWVGCGDVFAPFPTSRRECTMPPTTNGAALGSDAAMATTRALLELLERDSVMSFWYCGEASSGRTVSHDAVADIAAAQITFLDDLGYETKVLEVSRFTGLNVALAFARQREGHFPYAVCSAGAGRIDPAVSAAVSELVQTVLAASSAGPRYSGWQRAGMPLASLEHNMWWYATEALAAPVLESLWTSWEDLETVAEGELTIDAIEVARNAGVDCYAVDITPPPLAEQFSCARVISPALWPLVVSERHGPDELVSNSTRHPAPLTAAMKFSP